MLPPPRGYESLSPTSRCERCWHSGDARVESIKRSVVRVILAVIVARAWTDLGEEVIVPLLTGGTVFIVYNKNRTGRYGTDEVKGWEGPAVIILP